jgi:ribosomal protein L28
MRTIASAAASCPICTPTASGSETEKRFVSLRVTTRGLRTIEKRGVDVVVADLRAKGVKV